MVEVSVGQVAGFINASLLLVQITIPILLAIILVAVLDEENTAVTWTAAARFLNSTFLPMVLRTDSSASSRQGVRRSVVLVSQVSVLATIALAGARILSPIGLDEKLQAGGVKSVKFRYAPDLSPLHLNQDGPEDYWFCRSCDFGHRPCPGANTTPRTNKSSTVDWDGFLYVDTIIEYDCEVPDTSMYIFGSGVRAQGDLRSGPFDIQYRSYRRNLSPDTVVGNFQYTRHLLFDAEDKQYALKDGVIMDLVRGGIGFRNHTMPYSTSVSRKAVWKENLLWVMPVTECIGTNWTFHVQASSISEAIFSDGVADSFGPQGPESNASTDGLRLVYGASEIAQISGPGVLGYGQRLRDSAFELDEQIQLNFNVSANSTSPSINLFSTRHAAFANLDENFLEDAFLNKFALYTPDPYLGDNDGINESPLFKSLDTCVGYLSNETINTSRRLTRCGLMVSWDGASTAAGWNKHSLSICATGLVAKFRTVEFEYLADDSIPSLSQLSVRNVEDTIYDKDMDMPIWGIEDVGEEWLFGEMSPLWGPIDGQTFQDTPNAKVALFRSPNLHLPATRFSQLDGYFGPPLSDPPWGSPVRRSTQQLPVLDSMAASDGFDGALYMTYAQTGLDDHALAIKWRSLAQSPETRRLIPNLIWTDIVANAFTGTKSRLDGAATTTDGQGGGGREDGSYGDVTTFHRSITYDYRYGILAFVALAVWLVLVALALGFVVFGSRMSPARLRDLINKLSVGRALALLNKNNGLDDARMNQKSKDWIAEHGKDRVALFSGRDDETKSLVRRS